MNSTRERKAAVRDIIAVTMICVAVTAASAQTTWHVCLDGSGDFLTIQEGIAAAADGDVIEICDGTYKGDGNRDLTFGGKLITVRSENGPENCVIDCEGSELDPHRAFTFNSGEGAEAVLRGFTIQNGYMISGGAIHCAAASSPTIHTCVFRNNTAFAGASGYTGVGGAIACEDASSATILNCEFRNNTAIGGVFDWTGYGGGVFCHNDSEAVIEGCVFIENQAISGSARISGVGGGFAYLSSRPRVFRCELLSNQATLGGGAFGAGFHDSGGHIEQCSFISNRTNGSGGAAVMSSSPSDVVSDCTFVDNLAHAGGALNFDGLYGHGEVVILNCIFAGNRSEHLIDDWVTSRGGAIVNWIRHDLTVIDCLLVGNTAGVDGGAIITAGANTALIDCTIARNRARGLGGGARTQLFGGSYGYCGIDNCIVWRNTPSQLVGGETAVTYSDVQGGYSGIGNIDADPLFVEGPSGTWTRVATYDSNIAQTTFTDAGAAWDLNELAGKFLRPNPDYEPSDPNDPHELNGDLQSLIVSNTETTVTVWGNFAALGTAGASYAVYDYHVLPGSPCIDAADNTAVPADIWDLDGDGDLTERIPVDLDWRLRFADRRDTADNGIADLPDYPYVVDMGAYEYQCTGDLDGDCQVGLQDLALLLSHFGTPSGAMYADGDLDQDGDVALADLAALLAVYGGICP